MTVAMQIEVYGDDLVVESFRESAVRSVHLEPLADAIFRRMEGIEEEQFATDGGRSGRRWEPLDNRYMWQKWTQGLSIEILRATNDLMESLTGDSSYAIRFATAETFEFGSTLPEFAFQQDPPADADYPTRLPVDFTVVDVEGFSQMMMMYILGVTDKHGRRQRRFPAGAVVGGISVGGRFAPGVSE